MSKGEEKEKGMEKMELFGYYGPGLNGRPKCYRVVCVQMHFRISPEKRECGALNNTNGAYVGARKSSALLCVSECKLAHQESTQSLLATTS